MADMGLRCPDCGGAMELLESHKFVDHEGRPRRYWRCAGWPTCQGNHSARADGAPVGIPADRATRALRIEAHELARKIAAARGFDERSDYLLCASLMKDCGGHIGKMSAGQCKKLIAKLKAIIGGETNGEQAAAGAS